MAPLNLKTGRRLEVVRQGLTRTRIAENTNENDDLEQGEILVRIDRFGFSANNITYGVAGDYLRYWQFFPVEDNDGDEPDQWGVIPVWGFADVVRSNGSPIAQGERLFGYFPPADTVKMKPVDIKSGTFFEGADHRADLPRGYNAYTRVSNEHDYDNRFDNARRTRLIALSRVFSSRQFRDPTGAFTLQRELDADLL